MRLGGGFFKLRDVVYELVWGAGYDLLMKFGGRFSLLMWIDIPWLVFFSSACRYGMWDWGWNGMGRFIHDICIFKGVIWRGAGTGTGLEGGLWVVSRDGWVFDRGTFYET